MSKGFICSVLSTQRQRQRFYWIRNFVALFCAAGTFKVVGGTLGGIVAIGALLGGYFTIAPVIAFLVCLFEQMNS
ncbi:hypothetical protein NP590_05005 [Methylomonas sp. SURF-2]|uniref:Uncharacterized protein n=1 Tax=Methylomonas subterranea TaxID=2952225 RepID=A0ABT1TFF0_9GAMM|nr:hypothetical protein [Methylomonas sp. SURF-2]MCQ8103459.1 hypothetical protein [Methylomonas sp. SURF-2]